MYNYERTYNLTLPNFNIQELLGILAVIELFLPSRCAKSSMDSQQELLGLAGPLQLQAYITIIHKQENVST